MTAIRSASQVRHKFSHRWLVLAAVMLLFTSASPLADDQGDARLAAYHYDDTTPANAAVSRTLETARNEGKIALIALGAEWCHDSRGLGAHFSDPAMQKILNEDYVVEFVNVGFLEDRRAVTRPLGYPINFGTPTVLIIDPQSGLLLNFADVSIWQSADSVPLGEYTDYFSSLASDWEQGLIKPLSKAPSAELQSFTERNVDRLVAGYTLLGPLLENYADKTLEDTDEFEALWSEVRDFRGQLQKDITTRRLAEEIGDTSDTDIDWPEYGPFSWEQNDY